MNQSVGLALLLLGVAFVIFFVGLGVSENFYMLGIFFCVGLAGVMVASTAGR